MRGPSAIAHRHKSLIQATPTCRNTKPRDGGFRSILAVPMVREGQVIGTIAVARAEAGHSPTSRSGCCRPSPTRR